MSWTLYELVVMVMARHPKVHRAHVAECVSEVKLETKGIEKFLVDMFEKNGGYLETRAIVKLLGTNTVPNLARLLRRIGAIPRKQLGSKRSPWGWYLW